MMRIFYFEELCVPSTVDHPWRFSVRPLSLSVALAWPVWSLAQSVADPAPTGDTRLPAVEVQASDERANTPPPSEGTRSYTVPSSRTATPLNLSLRDTPQATSVVTAQRIQDMGLLNITDVTNRVTGLSVQQYETSRAQFTARGFKINSLLIDGVPTIWDQAWSSGEIWSSLAMYDRVEVVRGSTGLVAGAGEPSAAINLVRKRATATRLSGQVEASVGSWADHRVMADVSTPLNDAKTVRARVVAERNDRDSWVDHLGVKAQTLFATVEADLGANTLLSAGISRQTHDTQGPMWGGLPVFYSDGSRTAWPRHKTTAANWTRWDTRYDSRYVTLQHRLPQDWQLNASFTQGDRQADSYLLYLYGAPDRNTGQGLYAWPGSYQVRTRQDDWSVLAQGPFALLGRRHELAVGLNSSRQRFEANSRAASGAAPTAGDFNAWDGSGYAEPSWGSPAFYGAHTTRHDAVHATTRWHITAPLRVILGSRLNQYSRSGSTAATGAFSMKHDQVMTPYAGLTYALDADHSLYVSHADIFQPQTVRDSAGNYLDPVRGRTTEVGIKAEWLDGQVHGSAAVFRTRQDNLGVATSTSVPGTNPPETAYRATQGATSEGFELDLSGELRPGWSLSAGYSQFQLQDASGRDANTVYPRRLLRTATSYRLGGALQAWTVGGGLNWQSGLYTLATDPVGNTQRVAQGAYALVDLMTRVQLTRQLSAQLHVNNVFDQQYFNVFDAFGQMTYGAPRSARVNLRYTF